MCYHNNLLFPGFLVLADFTSYFNLSQPAFEGAAGAVICCFVSGRGRANRTPASASVTHQGPVWFRSSPRKKEASNLSTLMLGGSTGCMVC